MATQRPQDDFVTTSEARILAALHLRIGTEPLWSIPLRRLADERWPRRKWFGRWPHSTSHGEFARTMYVLERLGWVESSWKHLPNHTRQVRVYRLTTEGSQIAIEAFDALERYHELREQRS